MSNLISMGKLLIILRAYQDRFDFCAGYRTKHWQRLIFKAEAVDSLHKELGFYISTPSELLESWNRSLVLSEDCPVSYGTYSNEYFQQLIDYVDAVNKEADIRLI